MALHMPSRMSRSSSLVTFSLTSSNVATKQSLLVKRERS
jgi:hypothetical protein